MEVGGGRGKARPSGRHYEHRMRQELEQVSYGGWPGCYRLSNGTVDLIVTTDVGPRVIRFGFVGEGNEFKEYEEMSGLTGGTDWRIYGGHRLWQAPEDTRTTYAPDNGPVRLDNRSGFIRLVQPADATGVQKEIEIRLAGREAKAGVTHRLRNLGSSAVELAPWAISVMAPGGKAIVPLPARGSHDERLLPTNTIAHWAYTDMTDSRWKWGRSFVALQQDPQSSTPQKAGFMATDGWAAYARGGHLFVKQFHYVAGATYPDLGCTVETFTNAEMLELETLGPLVRLRPGESAVHKEQWLLFRGPSAGRWLRRRLGHADIG